jgi:hypothetical protein
MGAPDLQLDLFVAKLDGADLEVDTCRLWEHSKRASEKQRKKKKNQLDFQQHSTLDLRGRCGLTDGGDEGGVERVVRKAEEDARLSHTAVPCASSARASWSTTNNTTKKDKHLKGHPLVIGPAIVLLFSLRKGSFKKTGVERWKTTGLKEGCKPLWKLDGPMSSSLKR